MPKLSNKVAIITGAGQGQGAAASVLFAQEGANVVVADVDIKNGESTVKAINESASAGRAIFVKTDVSQGTEVEALVKAAMNEFGRLDIMYNNAGICPAANVLGCDLSEKDWDDTIAVDLKGVWLGCKYAIPEILKNGGGAVINTGSIWSLQAYPGMVAYNTAKAGVVMLTKTLASEYGKHNIRVNSILPGAIETPMLHEWYENADDPKALKKTFDGLHPMKRTGLPEEVAQVALFLASDQSSYVNGQPLSVDGGRAFWERPPQY